MTVQSESTGGFSAHELARALLAGPDAPVYAVHRDEEYADSWHRIGRVYPDEPGGNLVLDERELTPEERAARDAAARVAWEADRADWLAAKVAAEKEREELDEVDF